MSTFITGATGYIGSYVANLLLREHDERLALLVRAKDKDEAAKRLWKSLQLHMDFPTFYRFLNERIDIYLGDITSPQLGMDDATFKQLAKEMDSVIHIAASLNRKSPTVCFNVNLRGTLEVVKLARAAIDLHGLRRFSDVSTAAVAGERHGEVVDEEGTIEWRRRQYDPYARTKMFSEHMARELLPETDVCVFRPTIVLGDSRFPETTQFDMLRALIFLAKMKVIPLKPTDRVDIVPANYVSAGIVKVHTAARAEHHAYNTSSGTGSPTVDQLCQYLTQNGMGPYIFAPYLGEPFGKIANALMSTPKNWGLAPAASLMKVFWPYITYDTVLDNSRIQSALGYAPAPVTDYLFPLIQFAEQGGYQYPYKPWPEDVKAAAKLQGTAPGAIGEGA